MARSFATTTGVPSWSPSSVPDQPRPGAAAAGGPDIAAAAGTAAAVADGWKSQPRLIRLPDAAAVAERVAALLIQAALRRPQRALGLATGRTMEPVYAAVAAQLARLPAEAAGRLRRDWSSFNLDEYVGLGPGDPASFAAEMTTRLTIPLDLDPAGVRLPDGRDPDPDAAAARYGAAVAEAGGIGLQLLGLGLNGHLGFNEPPSGPDLPCRCLELSDSTRRQNAAAFGGDPAAVPRQAITLGLREILAADQLLLVVTGAAKAEVLRWALLEPPTPELPASWIQRHGAVTVIADQAALPDLLT